MDNRSLSLTEMQAVIDTLRRDLEIQWEYNHSEHCTNKWPHRGDCHWPKPVSLGGKAGVYRTYD